MEGLTERQTAMRMRAERGFTLIELLIVVAIVGVLAALALPGLLAARRSGNHASAVGSLRSINTAQRTYSSSCAWGNFASDLTQLGTRPVSGGEAFLSPDLGVATVASKSGYAITLDPASDGSAGTIAACNGVAAAGLTSSYYATAAPEVPGSTGIFYFWLGVSGTIFQDVGAIASTQGFSAAPGGRPIQ